MLKNLKLFLVLSMVLLVTSCNTKSDENPGNIINNVSEPGKPSDDATIPEGKYPLTITDFEGREYVIAKKPERIVSLSPSITETIGYLDGIGKLVGRTSYCDIPKEVLDVEVIGDMYAPNNEKIVSLEPDIIFASAHTDPSVIDYFAALDIVAVRVYTSDNIEKAFENIKLIGSILDLDEKAEESVTLIKNTIKEVENKVAGLEKPSVYYCIDAGENGDFAATGDTFIHELIEIAGGDNIAKDGKDYMYSLEKLLEHDPDIIIVSNKYGLKDALPQLEGYKGLKAVKNKNVIEIDDNPIDRACTSLDIAVTSLAKIFHPDVFSE